MGTMFKTVLVGAPGVGMNHLMHVMDENRALNEAEWSTFENSHRRYYEPVSVARFDAASHHLCFNSIWSTRGHDEYDRLRPLLYVDTDNRKSFDMVTSKVRIVHGDGEHAQYLPEISRTCPGVPVLLVGTKSDVMMTGIGSGNYDPTWDWHDECTYTDKLVIMSDLSAHAHTPQHIQSEITSSLDRKYMILMQLTTRFDLVSDAVVARILNCCHTPDLLEASRTCSRFDRLARSSVILGRRQLRNESAVKESEVQQVVEQNKCLVGYVLVSANSYRNIRLLEQELVEINQLMLNAIRYTPQTRGLRRLLTCNRAPRHVHTPREVFFESSV